MAEGVVLNSRILPVRDNLHVKHLARSLRGPWVQNHTGKVVFIQNQIQLTEVSQSGSGILYDTRLSFIEAHMDEEQVHPLPCLSQISFQACLLKLSISGVIRLVLDYNVWYMRRFPAEEDNSVTWWATYFLMAVVPMRPNQLQSPE